MRHRVKHRYSARRDGTTFGPWEAGDVIDIDPADAEWVERDSPGVLTPAADEKPAPTPRAEEPRKPGPDRDRKHSPQHRRW